MAFWLTAVTNKEISQISEEARQHEKVTKYGLEVFAGKSLSL